MGADRPILRALLGCPTTVLQHLTRTMAIAFVLCLVAKHHSNAEPININLLEYLYGNCSEPPPEIRQFEAKNVSLHV